MDADEMTNWACFSDQPGGDQREVVSRSDVGERGTQRGRGVHQGDDAP